jgi:hypothetical protein
MISRFSVGAAVSLLLADIATGRAQELPSSGGIMPELRRGANGQIEAVPKILPLARRRAGPALLRQPRPPVEEVHRPQFGLPPRRRCRPDRYGR